MGETIDIDTARWKAKPLPGDHKPGEALRAALHAIETGELKPLHVVVCVAAHADIGVKTSYYQAGDYNHHGQLGLLKAVGDLMDRSD